MLLEIRAGHDCIHTEGNSNNDNTAVLFFQHF
jgi:hypothetical protein